MAGHNIAYRSAALEEAAAECEKHIDRRKQTLTETFGDDGLSLLHPDATGYLGSAELEQASAYGELDAYRRLAVALRVMKAADPSESYIESAGKNGSMPLTRSLNRMAMQLGGADNPDGKFLLSVSLYFEDHPPAEPVPE